MTTSIQNGSAPIGLQKLGKALEARAVPPEIMQAIRDSAADRVATVEDYVARQISSGEATFGRVVAPALTSDGKFGVQAFRNAAFIELPNANEQGYIGKEYRKANDSVVSSVRLAYNTAILAKLKEDFGDALVAYGEKFDEKGEKQRIYAVISGESFAQMPGFKDLPTKSEVGFDLSVGFPLQVEG